MQGSNFGPGTEVKRDIPSEQSRARMEDVNRSTRPQERTLSEVRRGLS